MAIPVNPVTLYEGQPYVIQLSPGTDAGYGTSSAGLESPATADVDYKSGSFSGTVAEVSPFKVVTYADGIVEGEEHFSFTYSYDTGQVLNPIQTTVWTFTILDAAASTGTPVADAPEATPGADKLSGGGGNDTLSGLGADDTLIGGKGGDLLTGGEGKDRLTGGDGHDAFVFQEAGNANADTITDFATGIDKILLDDSMFTSLAPNATGGLKAANFHIGTSAGDANDHVIYDPGAGKLYYDRDGKGGEAKQLIATLAGSPDDLNHTDFQVL